MTERKGPKVTITYDCSGCSFRKEEKELDDSSPLGESLYSYYCTKSRRVIPYKGGYTVHTPDWCVFKKELVWKS